MEKPTIYHRSSTAKDKLLNIIHNIPKYAVQERSEDVIATIRAQRAARSNTQAPQAPFSGN